VQERVDALRAADPTTRRPAGGSRHRSGSGLDPHHLPAAALYQSIAWRRPQAAADAVRALVERHIEGRQLGFLGEPR